MSINKNIHNTNDARGRKRRSTIVCNVGGSTKVRIGTISEFDVCCIVEVLVFIYIHKRIYIYIYILCLCVALQIELAMYNV